MQLYYDLDANRFYLKFSYYNKGFRNNDMEDACQPDL